jgi:chromosome segregation ATPase
MFDNFGLSTAVAVVSVLFGAVLAGLVVVAVFRATYAKEQIIALRGDRDDLKERVSMLEQENLRVSTDLSNEKEKTKVLQQIVTGKEQLDHLQNTLDHFIETDVRWKDDQRDLAKNLLALAGGKRQGETT